MNHFFAVTSNGGYLGRFWWSNSHAVDHPDWGWGQCFWLRRNILFTGWWGEIGMIRTMLRLR